MLRGPAAEPFVPNESWRSTIRTRTPGGSRDGGCWQSQLTAQAVAAAIDVSDDRRFAPQCW